MLNPKELLFLENNGYILLKAQFPQEKLKNLNAIFLEKKHQLQCLSNWSYLNIFRESNYYQKFVKETTILKIAKQLLGDKVDLFWDSIAVKTPEYGKAFSWHQDSGYGETSPSTYYTFWVPLQNTTENNGCLWAKPGSHKEGLMKHEPTADLDNKFPGREIAELDSYRGEPILMETGDLLVFNSFLAHRSGINKSKENRTALAFAIHQRGFKELNTPSNLPEFPGLSLN